MKKIFATIVGAVASYYVVKYVTQLLEEKPLKARIDDAKDKANVMREDVLTKVGDLGATAKNTYGEALSKLDVLYDGKKD